jgi:tRNA A37 threonylcarbamoyladenosine dehydratase
MPQSFGLPSIASIQEPTAPEPSESGHTLLNGEEPQAEPSTPGGTQRTPEEFENYRMHRRFDRLGRLVGDGAMKRLMRSHVAVIGLGGVGSWAAESLARSGVGRLTLADFDEICITNANRQLHALSGLVGQKKALVMGERLNRINPKLEVRALAKFYNALSATEILGKGPAEYPDFVIDAIDNVTAKCHLLNFCAQNGIPVITSGGSGGRLDPTQIGVSDLSETAGDPLARVVRRVLRQEYGFPSTGKFNIQCVFSKEAPTDPFDLKYDDGKGFQCVCPNGDNGLHSCEERNLVLGNASFVTGAFGLTAASVVVRTLIQEK